MIYVGIDVASQKHDCFLLKDTGEVFSKTSFTIKNDFEGYKKTPQFNSTICGVI